MFSTYKQAILDYYLLKRTSGELPIVLKSPTPAGVRDYLVHYLASGYDQARDERTLEAFFGKKENAEAYARAVANVEIDDFRPVISWLKGKTLNPDDRHIHLAALLVDFERPHIFDKDYSTGIDGDVVGREVSGNGAVQEGLEIVERGGDVGDAEQGVPEEGADESLMDGRNGEGENEIFELGGNGVDTGPVPASGNRDVTEDVVKPEGNGTGNRLAAWWKSDGGKKATVPLVILLLAVLAVAIGLVGDGSGRGKQCMYWEGDRYVAIACDEQLAEGVEKVALDTFLLDNFRKINEPDTITARSIGKLWYLKHEKEFDYFTVRGKHPLYKRKLSRLSQRIYENEIDSKRRERVGE